MSVLCRDRNQICSMQLKIDSRYIDVIMRGYEAEARVTSRRLQVIEEGGKARKRGNFELGT